MNERRPPYREGQSYCPKCGATKGFARNGIFYCRSSYCSETNTLSATQDTEKEPHTPIEDTKK